MTNFAEDGEKESEEQSLGHKELDEIDLDISNIQKILDELKALGLQLSEGKRLKLLKEKLNLARPKLKLLTNSFGSTAVKVWYENKKKAEAYEFHINSDDGYDDNHLAIDDSDGDDDTRACFPCPFCYVDVEVHVLCSHLQDEHCFDLKNAVCPLCAANLGKDATGHFMVQHTTSLKRRRKSKKSGLWTGSSAMFGKDLSSCLGSSTNGRTNTHEAAPDPLLSPFLRNVAHSEPKGSQDDKASNKSAHLTSLRSSGISSPEGGNELDYEERKQKAEFIQQLIASTIF